MENLLNQIETIKDRLNSSEYNQIMNSMKEINEQINWYNVQVILPHVYIKQGMYLTNVTQKNFIIRDKDLPDDLIEEYQELKPIALQIVNLGDFLWNLLKDEVTISNDNGQEEHYVGCMHSFDFGLIKVNKDQPKKILNLRRRA